MPKDQKCGNKVNIVAQTTLCRNIKGSNEKVVCQGCRDKEPLCRKIAAIFYRVDPTRLCNPAEVPMSESEQFMKPTRSIIGGTLDTHYVKLNAKLDGMIRWLQETGPVLQEFARMNGLRAPNYPPYMFSLTTNH
ncbi:hypothetical protein Gotur_012606 [Gossypium turneri]